MCQKINGLEKVNFFVSMEGQMTIFMVDSNLGRSWGLESHPNGGSPQGASLAAVTLPYGDVIKLGLT
jgi:hypothetical protein